MKSINAQRFSWIPERVQAETYPRPFSRGALILKAITPLRENRVWPRETSFVAVKLLAQLDHIKLKDCLPSGRTLYHQISSQNRCYLVRYSCYCQSAVKIDQTRLQNTRTWMVFVTHACTAFPYSSRRLIFFANLKSKQSTVYILGNFRGTKFSRIGSIRE